MTTTMGQTDKDQGEAATRGPLGGGSVGRQDITSGGHVPWGFLVLLGTKDRSGSPWPPRAGPEDTLSFWPPSSLEEWGGWAERHRPGRHVTPRGRGKQRQLESRTHGKGPPQPARDGDDHACTGSKSRATPKPGDSEGAAGGGPDGAVQGRGGLAQGRAQHVRLLAAGRVAVEGALGAGRLLTSRAEAAGGRGWPWPHSKLFWQSPHWAQSTGAPTRPRGELRPPPVVARGRPRSHSHCFGSGSPPAGPCPPETPKSRAATMTDQMS